MTKVMEKLFDTVIRKAKDAGAESPVIGECSDGNAVVVDIESGRVYTIEVKELK